MRAGAGKARIDLRGVLPIDGFGAERDPLHVRAVVFQNPDGTRACLVSVDATSMRDDAALRAAASQATGCDSASVWVTVTHTFSAPHVRTPGHLATDEERERNSLLARRLVQATSAACADAIASLVPVCLQTAQATGAVNVNRDVETPDGWWLGANPNGFSDRSVRVARLAAKDDPRHTVATLYSADVQPSATQGLPGQDGRPLVSADLCGDASRLLEERLGGVAVFLVGAAGDQAPSARGDNACAELGQALASAVQAALAGARDVEVPCLSLTRRVVSCPAQRRADFAKLAPTRHYEFVPDGAADTTIFVARMGSLTVVGIQPEIDSSLGARLRAVDAGRLEVLTMVNGAQKYLPCAQAYDRITYEAMNSSFARGASEVLEREIRRIAGADRAASRAEASRAVQDATSQGRFA